MSSNNAQPNARQSGLPVADTTVQVHESYYHRRPTRRELEAACVSMSSEDYNAWIDACEAAYMSEHPMVAKAPHGWDKIEGGLERPLWVDVLIRVAQELEIRMPIGDISPSTLITITAPMRVVTDLRAALRASGAMLSGSTEQVLAGEAVDSNGLGEVMRSEVGQAALKNLTGVSEK